MEDTSSSNSIPSLICQEDHSPWLFKNDDNNNKETHNSNSSEHEDIYIKFLSSKETAILTSVNSSAPLDIWSRNARSDAIQWIMEMKDCFSFRYETVYLSIAYFDKFLLLRSIDREKQWVVKLLAVSCLSLAAKMEECDVPALYEYDTGECRFNSNTLQRMELLVLSTLDWRMNLPTPFPYLNFFASKLHLMEESDKLVVKSFGCVFSILEDINLIEYHASTIAAAAIIAASSDLRLTECLLISKLRTLSSCGSIQDEHVMTCYALMTQESHEESDSFVYSESSSFTSNNNKRRRLLL